ncbi:MAG: hypothetical protein KA201_00005, partial [Kofleriaceae bacterium]|nr:hypothetical protein [Kofleriaceae bacterium]
MRLRLPLTAAALVIVSALAAPSAHAGTLAGKLELPPDVGAPPVLPRGYLPRIDNPLAPVRPLDP